MILIWLSLDQDVLATYIIGKNKPWNSDIADNPKHIILFYQGV